MLHSNRTFLNAGDYDAQGTRTKLETPTESGLVTYTDTVMEKGRPHFRRAEKYPGQGIYGYSRDVDSMGWP
jgi:hypothetical protein